MLDSDFVVVCDVLSLLEIIVSLGLAILGETEKTVGLDDFIAEPNTVIINRYLSIFSHVKELHRDLIMEAQNGSSLFYCSNEVAVLS